MMTSETNYNTNTDPADPQRPEPGETNNDSASTTTHDQRSEADAAAPKEIGGRSGPDPVRYGDWEKQGRCIDF